MTILFTISGIVFFVLIFLLIRLFLKLAFKKLRKFNVLSLIITCIIYPLLLLFIINTMSFKENKKFNPNLWKENQEERQYMLNDVIDNILTKKMSKEDVLISLGEPSSIDEDKFEYVVISKAILDFEKNIIIIKFENDSLHSVKLEREYF